MPRKTKEINQEKTVKEQSILNEKINALIQNILEPDNKVSDTEKPAKKTNSKSTSTKTKATASKGTKTKADKSTVKEKATKTRTTSKAETTTSKKATKSTSAKTKSTTKSKTTSTKIVAPTVVEYYDLPYKYNQTVVKVLYQNPTTLFVYWEIPAEICNEDRQK